MMLIAQFDTSNVEEEIMKLEVEYRFRFPEQYRHFLLRYNGGRTPKTEFKVKPRRKRNVNAFYGYATNENIYDLKGYPVLVDEWVEAGFIPIAEDGLGSDYLIGIKQQNYGKIYIADYDEQELELVRDSFHEFVLSCNSKRIGKVLSCEEREKMMIEEGHGHLITDALRMAWQEEVELYGNMVQEKVVLD